MAGVGVFFGTFNPMHFEHVRLAHELLTTRGLSKVYVHLTVVPKSDRDALASGEIRVAAIREGRVVYETTPKAKPEKDYFRTGREFYSYGTRLEMARLAFKETGADPRIVLLDQPSVYEAEGFAGIIRYVRELHPGAALHGIHGDDVGGLLVRGIYDREGVQALQVERRNGVSATRIRDGAIGMTSAGVDAMVMLLRVGADNFTINGQHYRFDGARLFRAVAGAGRAASF